MIDYSDRRFIEGQTDRVVKELREINLLLNELIRAVEGGQQSHGGWYVPIEETRVFVENLHGDILSEDTQGKQDT